MLPVRLLAAVLCHPYDYLKLFINSLVLVKNSHFGSVINLKITVKRPEAQNRTCSSDTKRNSKPHDWGSPLTPQARQPLRDARVTLQSGSEVALTKANGEFVLDSLPSGTQALEIRKLGYSVTEVPGCSFA